MFKTIFNKISCGWTKNGKWEERDERGLGLGDWMGIGEVVVVGYVGCFK